jgi:putative ABC transport system ATP-binding protein
MLLGLNERYGQTIVIITHDSEAASTADRTIEMRDGRILNQGKNVLYAMEEKHS